MEVEKKEYIKGGVASAVYRDMVKLREEMDAIIETLEIMGDEELMEGIRRSEEDLKAGRYKELKNVEELDEIWG
ncbi:MAG: hypothetical protein OD815_001781 [Candidatus Alkanophagales archaeon MCA70_species_2]|nr:hypothetical protein [Candidatus Alkanophaga liquidiphilum]